MAKNNHKQQQQRRQARRGKNRSRRSRSRPAAQPGTYMLTMPLVLDEHAEFDENGNVFYDDCPICQKLKEQGIGNSDPVSPEQMAELREVMRDTARAGLGWMPEDFLRDLPN